MKVALVTGGSRGIGRAIVEGFHNAGYRVAFTYSSNEAAANTLAEQLGPDVMALRADVRDFARCRRKSSRKPSRNSDRFPRS